MSEITVKQHRINELLKVKKLPQASLTSAWRFNGRDRGRLYRILENKEVRLYADEESFFLDFFNVDQEEFYLTTTKV